MRCKSLLKSFLVLLPLLALPLTGRAAEADGCMKLVFESYCLGGSLKGHLRRYPAKLPVQEKGDRTGVIYETGSEKTYVMAFKDKIYKILHTYEPPTHATVRDIRESLQSKYGEFKDMSVYPDNTRNKARQISAIRRGEGELRNVWQLPDQAWRIELGWSRELGVFVAYYANDLDSEQKAAAWQGL